MRTYNIILLFIATCISGVVFFFACTYTYESKLSVFKQKAKSTFIEAVDQEVKRRNVEGPLVSYFEPKYVAADVPDSVCIRDSLGIHEYPLDRNKHYMNITSNRDLRALHSYTFGKHPIIADSLNIIWREYLLEAHLPVESALSVSVTDEKGKVKSCNKTQCEWCNFSNIIFTVYIGYACEIEVKGYIYYSIWSIIHFELLLYLLLCIFIVYGMYKTWILVRKKLVLMQQKNTIEVLKIVKEVDSTPVRSYMLKEDMIFYAEKKTIELRGIKTRLSPQANELLELFLNNKEKHYILKDDEIMSKLWPNRKERVENVHKAVGRLRNILHKLDSDIDIKRGVESYQLIL